MDGGLGLDLGRESEEFRPATVTPAVRRHCRRRGGLGRARLGARVHQTEIRAHRGMRGRKGVSAMPIRRPGTAGSAVAAMAGDHGLWSSRPELKKPRKEKVEVPGDRGRLGVLTAGRKEDGEAQRRRSVRRRRRRIPATFGCGGCGLPRCLASAKTRAGSSWVRAGGLAPLNRGRGAGDAPTMREERAQFGGGCG